MPTSTPALVVTVVVLRRAVRAGGDLPVGDLQSRVAAVQLDVDRAGRERTVVEMAAVGVIECLGELADHLQTGLQD